MKLTNLKAKLAQKLHRFAVASAAGAALLIGATTFVGGADAATLIWEDYEVASPGTSGWVFSQYGTGSNYSASPHSSIPGGGSFYGWAPGGTGLGPGVDNVTSVTHNLGIGDTVIDFDGWLASYTANDDYARFEAEFFAGSGGSGASLGTVVLADGSMFTAADGVTESIDINGTIVPGDAGALRHNWKHYVSSNPIPGGSLSVVLSYIGSDEGVNNGNDAYSDNIHISTVPEPGALALLGLGSLALVGLRRKR